MKDTLRWVLVLPAAVGAYLGGFLVSFLVLLWIGSGWFNAGIWITAITNAAVCPVCFMLAGTATAPRFKLQTGIVLAIIHAVAISVLTAIQPFTREPQSVWWNILVAAIGVCATVAVVFRFRFDETDSRTRDLAEVKKHSLN